MYLKEIDIQNFKGLENKTFSFNSKFNVAIGNNASGKSTLLHSIQVALGGYLQCLDIPASRNYRRQFKDGEAFVKWNDLERSYLRNQELTQIKTTASFSHVSNDIHWTRIMLKNNTTSHNQRNAGELMAAVEQLLRQKTQTQIPMPIVASFGTERTVAQLRKGKKAQSRRTSREKAFLAALSEKVDFDGVIEWMHNYDKELQYKKEFAGTKDAVFNAIHTAIPYLKNVEYNNYYQEFEAEAIIDNHTIGKTLHSNMSDGLKAMLNLVAELAFRCVILNGYKGESAVLQTEGVVLIDELDMHLHPNWQMHVVKDLKNAFPSLQFIVTSHSPFIVQSLVKEELIILEEELDVESDPFRRSIEEISSTEMGVKEIPRSQTFIEMEAIAAKYYDLIEQGRTSENDAEVAELRNQLNELEDKFSEDPAFVALLKSERKSSNL
jgi:predicted ATP-binding protein involved in virulence